MKKNINHTFVEEYRVREGMAIQMDNMRERTKNIQVPIEQDEALVFKVSDDMNTLTQMQWHYYKTSYKFTAISTRFKHSLT